MRCLLWRFGLSILERLDAHHSRALQKPCTSISSRTLRAFDAPLQKETGTLPSLALVLPDICGHLEHPSTGSQKRYTKWFKDYLGGKYCPDSIAPLTWISPDDCYALRCAVVHYGTHDLTTQHCKDILDETIFLKPNSNYIGLGGHCMRLHNMSYFGRFFKSAIVLHISTFCEDMCEGVVAWSNAVGSQPAVMGELEKLLVVY